MKTLRQEIEKLISDLTKMHIERKGHQDDYVRGRGDGIELAVDNLTDILSRHHEEPAAPSQRERIATAIMLELIRNSSNPEWTYAMLAEPSVTAADALIEELNKKRSNQFVSLINEVNI